MPLLPLKSAFHNIMILLYVCNTTCVLAGLWLAGLGLAVIRHLLNDKLLPEASVMDRGRRQMIFPNTRTHIVGRWLEPTAMSHITTTAITLQKLEVYAWWNVPEKRFKICHTFGIRKPIYYFSYSKTMTNFETFR